MDGSDVEDHSSSVALVAQKPFEKSFAANSQRLQSLADLSDPQCLDLHGDFSGLASFLGLALVLQAEVKGHQAGGGVADRSQFQNLGVKRQSIHAVSNGAVLPGTKGA